MSSYFLLKQSVRIPCLSNQNLEHPVLTRPILNLWNPFLTPNSGAQVETFVAGGRAAGITAHVPPSTNFTNVHLFELGGGGEMQQARQSPSTPVRFFPISQYLLESASGVWALECGVLTSPPV